MVSGLLVTVVRGVATLRAFLAVASAVTALVAPGLLVLAAHSLLGRCGVPLRGYRRRKG